MTWFWGVEIFGQHGDCFTGEDHPGSQRHITIVCHREPPRFFWAAWRSPTRRGVASAGKSAPACGNEI